MKFLTLLVLILFPFAAQADNQELSGDTKLACEAILCLSSGTRPGECGPSLSRYFGISHKKWKDTVKSRRNFLNQCPAGNPLHSQFRWSHAVLFEPTHETETTLNAAPLIF